MNYFLLLADTFHFRYSRLHGFGNAVKKKRGSYEPKSSAVKNVILRVLIRSTLSALHHVDALKQVHGYVLWIGRRYVYARRAHRNRAAFTLLAIKPVLGMVELESSRKF